MATTAAVYPDPIVTKRKDPCLHCGRPMGSIRVHEGSGELQHRGKLVQSVSCIMLLSSRDLTSLSQCSDHNCHWTVYLTDAYMFNDARYLLGRVLAREQDPEAYAVYRTVPGAVLRLAPPVPAKPAPVPAKPAPGRIDCAKGCLTKGSKTPTAANRDCVGLLCKKCCAHESTRSLAHKLPRQYCKVHKVPGYEGELHLEALQP